MTENKPSTPALTKNRSNFVSKVKKHPKILALAGLFLVMFLVGVSLALVQNTKKSTENRSQASVAVQSSAKLKWAANSSGPILGSINYPANSMEPVQNKYMVVATKNLPLYLYGDNNVLALSVDIIYNPQKSYVKVEPTVNGDIVGQAKNYLNASNGLRKIHLVIAKKPNTGGTIPNGMQIAKATVWAQKQNADDADPSFNVVLANFKVVTPQGVSGNITSNLESKTLAFAPSNSPTNTPTITPTPIHTPSATPPRDLTPTTSPEPTIPVSECELPAKLNSLVGDTSGSNAIFTWRASSACNTKINQDQAYVWWQIIDLDNNKERIASSWNPSGSNLDNNRVLVNCENRNNHHLRMDAFISEIGKGYTSYNQSIMRGKVKSANIQCP